MIGLRLHRLCMLAALALAAPVAAAEFAAEVYRDESITLRAGLQGSSSQYVHFGDVLVLIMAVSYDPDNVSIQNFDESLFTMAWPANRGARLLDWQVRRDARSEAQEIVYASYRFQILGCPDDATPTCPGDRDYRLPQFVLEYQDLTASDAAAHAIRFRPWPDSLTVATTLQSDEEGQLLPFESYFPAGGYPEPLVGEDGIGSSVVTAGITLVLLMGGLIMWPFRSRTQATAALAVPRWQQQLQVLRAADAADDARFLDALRRCLVWYCNDELRLDPFIWLDLAESGDDSGAHSSEDRNHADVRSLFVDLLHKPAGQGVELRNRLEAIVSRPGRA